MGARNYWSNTWSSPAMRNTECFVEIKVRNISAKLSGLRQPNECIEICTIYVYLSPGIVNQSTNF